MKALLPELLRKTFSVSYFVGDYYRPSGPNGSLFYISGKSISEENRSRSHS